MTTSQEKSEPLTLARPLPRSPIKNHVKITLLVILALSYLGLWFVPPSSGLSAQSWHLFLIFFATIIGIMTQVVPMGVVAILSLTLCSLSHTLSINQTLAAFGSPISWLIFVSFLLARGFIKTGLGTRVAYHFICRFGHSSLGLAYGLVTTELVLSPFTPSNTSRGAGIIFPIISALIKEFDSSPQAGTQRKIGSYLIMLGYQANVVTCTLFITACAANPLAVILAQEFGVQITWGSWAMAACLPGLVCLFLLPLVLYYAYPPSLDKTPTAPLFARQKLAELGPLKSSEKWMLGIFLLLLVLWIAGPAWGVDATTAALAGLSLLLLAQVLTWDDILKESNAWNTFLWMSTLLMICQQLSEVGFIAWFGNQISPWISPLSAGGALFVLTVVNFLIHYIFASTTAHISAIFGVLMSLAIAAGAPPYLAAFSLVFSSNLSAAITHYGTGPAPIYFGENFVSVKQWWKIGGILGVFYFVVWGAFGPLWWKLLHFW